MADLFDSAWLKWAGGVVESQVLADNINALRDQGKLHTPIQYSVDYDAKRHCLIYTVAHIDSPFPPLWGVLLGNIVHNFRSCLDHIAWGIYKRGRTPDLGEPAESKVYFPVTNSPRHFNKVLKTKLPGARRADVATVRAAQPWVRGKRNLERHVVWVVDDLAQKDKHRSIQPVLPVPESTGVGIGKPVDCEFRRLGPGKRGVLQPGAELARLYVKKTGPEPYIHVEPEFTIDPSVEPRLTIEEFLVKTSDALRGLLWAFQEPPQNIAPILGGMPKRPGEN